MRLSPIRAQLSCLARREDGYTMIAVIGAVAMISLLLTAAVAATNQDQHMVLRDLDQKRAYAGGAGRHRRLHLPPQQRQRVLGPLHRRAGAQRGQPRGLHRKSPADAGRDGRLQVRDRADPGHRPDGLQHANPTGTMLESTGPNIGTFRIRSTGFSGSEKAVDRRAPTSRRRFLDYVYFTQYETSDPVTYGFANPSPELTAAYNQCTKFRRDGRHDAPGRTNPSGSATRSCSSPGITSTGPCTPTTTSASSAGHADVRAERRRT